MRIGDFEILDDRFRTLIKPAARVEKLNKRFESRVLVTGAVWDRLGAERPAGEALGAVALDGRAEPVRLHRLA